MAAAASCSSHWPTDWKKCCLCQQDKSEELKCPPIKYQPEQDGYDMIASNVPLFHALNDMPLVLDPARLDEGIGIAGTLRKNRAVYHQSCRYLFNNTKLERANKRKYGDGRMKEGGGRSKMKRASVGEQPTCFLCEKEDPVSEMRQAMTMNLSQRVNEYAQFLSDGKLLAKLSGGDAIAQELKYHPSCFAGLYNRARMLWPQECFEKAGKDRSWRYYLPSSILWTCNLFSGN